MMRPLDIAIVDKHHGRAKARAEGASVSSTDNIALRPLSQRAKAPGLAPARPSEAASEQEQTVDGDADGSSGQATPDEYVTSEGGLWAWIVVAGSAIFFFVVLGLIYSFGILQAELLQRNYANSSTLGWVSSTTVVFMPLLAIPITWLISKTSNRFVGLLGALCTGFGYFATSYTFDKPIYALFLAQSLFGIGYALTFWSCSSLAGQYFVRKRGLAVGIVYAGSGVGGAVFNIGLSRLIVRVGLEWAIRIYGLIALVVLTPVSFTLRSNKEVPMASFKLAYLKQLNFALLTLATGLMTFSLFVPPFFLPSYAVAAGLPSETGAWLVAGYNLASAVGRVVFGYLSDSRLGPLTSLCLSMALMAISILAVWMTSSGLIAPLIVFLLINGAASGALLSLQPPVLSSLYGVSQMAVTMAMVTMSRAFGSALGPAIAGYLLDLASGGQGAVEAAKTAAAEGHPSLLGTKPYLLPIGVMGGISTVAAASLALLRWRLAGADLKKRV